MIHNGIAYGLLQAYAEGLDIYSHANSSQVAEAYRCDLKIGNIADVWRRGSVVNSWRLGLAAMALLSSYTGQVQDSGVLDHHMTAVEAAVPATVLSAALYARCRSRQEHAGAEKVLSAMRHKFGGHNERPTGG
jgi:6-phosphogluconate dehydrogenase